MDQGMMRERIVIQTNVTTPDTQGGRSSSWGTLATVWAALLPVPAGNEAILVQAVTSRVSYTFGIRWLATVTAKQRVVWTPSWSSATAAKTLEIVAVRPEPSGPTEYMALDCAERA